MLRIIKILVGGITLSAATIAWSGERPAHASAGNGTGKLIALTYDDGPTEVTPRLLEVLKAGNAKATFFPNTINVRAIPQVMRKMAAEGHAIGNHAISHSRLTERPLNLVRAEIEGANTLLTEISGQRPTILRPPYAAVNDGVIETARENGLIIVMWSIYPERFAFSARSMRERVTQTAKDADIVFMHDTTVQAVDATRGILEELSAKGFEFVTVPELIRRRGTFSPGSIYQTGHGVGQ